jgi:hypothetical protein
MAEGSDAEEEKAILEAGKKKEKKEKKSTSKNDELDVGSVIEAVKVKEVNYFDGKYIVTQKSQLVDADVLNYASLQVGQFVKGKVC